MLDNIFGNSIVRKVEKKRKLESELEVLRKQQKVESDSVVKKQNVRKAELVSSTESEINMLKARIAALKANETAQCKLFDESLKVELDKVIMEFNLKIINKSNKIKKLGHLIEAEKMSIQDVIEPSQPHAPTKQTLLEKK